ncbi:MAG: amino acid permease [Calditrichaeota bacterium]|nr:MAG: amino acid permease [Calditrichota bacterium]
MCERFFYALFTKTLFIRIKNIDTGHWLIKHILQPMKENSRQNTQLQRSLSRFDAIMMIVGNMVGIGIFTTTGYYAQYLATPLGLYVVWLGGAIYAFSGAMVYAELATRFPRAGGDYLFLSNAYHPLLGFLFGWSTFTVTYPGSIATIAIGFAYYFLQLFPPEIKEWVFHLPGVPFSLTSIKLVAIGIVFVLTWLNSRGLRSGAGFQNFVVVLGILVLLAFVAMGLISPQGEWGNFVPFFPEGLDFQTISLWGVALIGVVFTYSGWTVLVYIAGEVKAPQKNIPYAMGVAVLLVAILYVLINTVYLYAQPLTQMSGDVEIGYLTMRILFGENTGTFFSIMIIIMVLSSLNSTILSGARIYYAMAAENRFFRFVAHIHPKFRVPANSLWLQFGWTTLLILLGTFNQLLTYTVFVMVLFSLLAGIALFLLRRRSQPPENIFLAWGYPVVPVIYLGISFWLLGNTLYHRPVESVIGVSLVLAGIPFYYWWEKKKKNN